MPGWGNHNHPISTQIDSAQLYFNQGLNLYYSYHLKQAFASFKEAARFDNTCAMAYWGQALSMGPYYNSSSFKMNKELPTVIHLMNELARSGNNKERALIKAMQQRYSSDTTNRDRQQLDERYASSMASLIKVYPQTDTTLRGNS